MIRGQQENLAWQYKPLHGQQPSDLSIQNFLWPKCGIGHPATAHGMYGRQGRCTQGMVRRPGGKRAFGRPRHRWKDNIKMDLKEVGRGGMNWIDLVQDRER